jgi:hypothetical protein
MRLRTPQPPTHGLRESRHALRRFVRSFALFLLIAVGGATLLLILAPLFGYLPYSDRPGPGWYARFPAMGWNEFWTNGWSMLGFGLFFAFVFLVPGALAVLLIQGFEYFVRNRIARRAAATLIAALGAAWWMLGAGWYISAGMPLVVLAVLLGAFAGGAVLASPPWCTLCRPP